MSLDLGTVSEHQCCTARAASAGIGIPSYAVLGAVKGPLASLGGCAALDCASAPRVVASTDAQGATIEGTGALFVLEAYR